MPSTTKFYKAVKDNLISIMPEDMPKGGPQVSNHSIWFCRDFIVGDCFKCGDYYFTINKVQPFSLDVDVEKGGLDGLREPAVNLKRLETFYLRNNKASFQYIARGDYVKQRDAEDAKQYAKKQAKALERKRAQLAKLQAEIEEMENE